MDPVAPGVDLASSGGGEHNDLHPSCGGAWDGACSPDDDGLGLGLVGLRVFDFLF